MNPSFFAKFVGLLILGLVVVFIIDPLDRSTTCTPFCLGIILMALSLRQSTALVVATSLIYSVLTVYALIDAHQYYAAHVHVSPHPYFSLFQRSGLFFVLCGLAIYLAYYRTDTERTLSRLQDILGKMPAPIVISDATGIILYANDALCAASKQSATGIIGRRYVDLLMSDIHEGKAMRYYIEIFGGQDKNIHEIGVHPFGSPIPTTARLICVGTGPRRVMITLLSNHEKISQAGPGINFRPSMRFSIVTPSYRQPEWLRLCAASVADQGGPGVEIEHIVQDSLSGPEIAEALAPFPQVKLVSEKDNGMYDALIRGWEKGTGDILCWLNCDEQYLPGALKEVANYFCDHPEVEVLFADTIVIDAGGGYLCSRQVLIPQLYHTWTCHLQPFSCATFFRSSLLKGRGISLDPTWKDVGDAELVIRLLRSHVRMGIVRRYIAAFVDDGNNRNLRSLAQQERQTLTSHAPGWAQALRLVWMLLHRLRRLWHGHYWPRPFAYDIFTRASPNRRSHFAVLRPTFYWKTRMGNSVIRALGGRLESPQDTPNQSPAQPGRPGNLLWNVWQPIKSLINGFLWSHPSWYRAVEKLRFRIEGFDSNFDLLFDGFPRSGNTFGSMMVLVSQQDRLKVRSRRHNPRDFIRSVKVDKPACLTLRRPVDAISSWIIYNNLSIDSMVRFYINFYRILLPYRSSFLVLPFYAITGDMPLVIDLINLRFGMNLERQFDLEACKIKALERIDNVWRNDRGIVNEFQVARPHPAREQRKMELKQELLSPRYSDLLRRCEELYQIYEREFLSRLPPENRFHDPAYRHTGSRP